jgi:hypothetical protein
MMLTQQVGAEFRLGEWVGTWTGTRFRGRAGCGVALIVVLIFGAWAPLSYTSGSGRGIAVAITLAIAALAIAMAAVPPRTRTDRLYGYQLGIALVDAQQPEPVVLRWVELTSVTLKFASGYEGPYLSSCALRDRAGNTVTVTRSWRANACAEIARFGQDALAPRLVPRLLQRYELGEPLTFGHLIIDQSGIGSPSPASGKAWTIRWQEMREVTFALHGHRVTVKRTTGIPKEIALDGAPNDFLARFVIEHAARRAGVPVISVE